MQKTKQASFFKHEKFTGILILAMILMSSFSAHARNLAIRKHLLDASALNKERAPLYAVLTDDKSLPLSHELIALENFSLIITVPYDLKAQKYFDKGVLLFHKDLIDMKETPAFSSTFPLNNAPVERVAFHTTELKRRWLLHIRNDDFKSVYEEAVTLLDEGALKATNQNCLSRHFVESIARALFNFEEHRQKARELNLDDPKDILLGFLKIQIHALPWAHSLDRRAFEIQQNNVALFCQDVPHIPYK